MSLSFSLPDVAAQPEGSPVTAEHFFLRSRQERCYFSLSATQYGTHKHTPWCSQAQQRNFFFMVLSVCHLVSPGLQYFIHCTTHYCFTECGWIRQGELLDSSLSLIATDRIGSGWGAASMEEVQVEFNWDKKKKSHLDVKKNGSLTAHRADSYWKASPLCT